MLRINTEQRKGILFIRLVGRIDNAGYLDEINKIVETVGIQQIVLNIEYLSNISMESIKQITNYHKQILKKKKTLLICDKTRNRLFKNTIPNIKHEIEAFSLIN